MLNKRKGMVASMTSIHWGKKFQLISLLIIAFLLSGCWSQEDKITIKSNGIINFKSEIIITKKDVSALDVDEGSDSFIKDLVEAGWHVEKKWISISNPRKLLVTGEGNLHKIGRITSFYLIGKLNKNTFEINFLIPESLGGVISRSIVFEIKNFDGAKVVDSDGNTIKEIKNVSEEKTYKIIL